MICDCVVEYRLYLHALETRTRSDSYVFAYSVSVSVDQTTGPSSCSTVSVGEEMRWYHSGCRGGSGGYVDRRGLCDGTFVSWTTETIDVLLIASEYGRRATLLQADYVATETEAEITRIVSGYLLRRHVYFTTVSVFR